MNEQKAIKVYVQVAAVFTEDGLMLPRSLVWEDGVRYKIDRVGDIKQAAAMRCGGQETGTRATLLHREINTLQTYKYDELVFELFISISRTPAIILYKYLSFASQNML